MPFEPLHTDEKLEKAVKSGPDFDSQMLGGCGAFVASSFISYGLAVWPHFVFPSVYLIETLALNSLFGMMPSLIYISIVSRKYGLAAAAGSVGGSVATAIFLFLRLQQIFMASSIKDAPQPEWPAIWVWMVPTAFMGLALLAVIAFLRKGEFSDESKRP